METYSMKRYIKAQEKRHTMTKKPYWKKGFLLCLAALLLGGCAGQGKALEGAEKDEWIRIATPIAENILYSIDNDDYEAFVADFSVEMKNSMPLQGFTDLRNKLQSTIGTYISMTPASVIESGEYVTVIFIAQYEKEEKVTVRVVFKKGDEKHEVYGLWFDSQKLRG